MSTSSRSASFANPPPASEEGSQTTHMSRSSEIASDFGRRLRISGSDMPVTTRGQASREKEQVRQQTSQSSGRGSGRSSRQPKVTAGSSRAAKSSKSGGKARKDPSPEEESDDDDEDDDPDDSDDDDGRQLPPPENRYLQIMIVYEPNNLTYEELNGRLETRLPENSRLFRDAQVFSGQVHTRTGTLQNFERQVLPLGGDFWWREVDRKLEERYEKIFAKYDNGSDALRTIDDIKQYFSAIDLILRNYQSYRHDAQSRLIYHLLSVLGNILKRDVDQTNSRAAALPRYVGDESEFNLFYRFANTRDWLHCLNIMNGLHAGAYRDQIRGHHASFLQIYSGLLHKPLQTANAQQFATVLRNMLQGFGMGVA